MVTYDLDEAAELGRVSEHFHGLLLGPLFLLSHLIHHFCSVGIAFRVSRSIFYLCSDIFRGTWAESIGAWRKVHVVVCSRVTCFLKSNQSIKSYQLSSQSQHIHVMARWHEQGLGRS